MNHARVNRTDVDSKPLVNWISVCPLLTPKGPATPGPSPHTCRDSLSIKTQSEIKLTGSHHKERDVIKTQNVLAVVGLVIGISFSLLLPGPVSAQYGGGTESGSDTSGSDFL